MSSIYTYAMLPDRHAPTQETEPANARTGPETFPSSPERPVVAAGGKLDEAFAKLERTVSLLNADLARARMALNLLAGYIEGGGRDPKQMIAWVDAALEALG